jgi:hypothetical protein
MYGLCVLAVGLAVSMLIMLWRWILQGFSWRYYFSRDYRTIAQLLIWLWGNSYPIIHISFVKLLDGF